MYPMPQGPAKCAATLPLISEFDKKPKLGLTDEGCKKLNEVQSFSTQVHNFKNPVDIPTRSLVMAFREVALLVPTIDRSWREVDYCAKHISGLPASEIHHLASIWIEACDTKDWTNFANYCALHPFHRRATVAAALCSFTPCTFTPGRVWQDSGIGIG